MKAIVYTSNTGHTAKYAKMLGEKTSLPVYALGEAKKQLSSGTEIIYLGWLFANGIKGYKKAAKKYKISAICAVGLCVADVACAGCADCAGRFCICIVCIAELAGAA